MYWGGQGGYSQAHIMDFERQSGKHPAVFNYFISWNASDSAFHWLSFRLADARAQHTAAMLSVAPEDTGLTPRDLAQGGGDDFLVGLNNLLAEHGEVTFLRPLSEMNNGNNAVRAVQPGRLVARTGEVGAPVPEGVAAHRADRREAGRSRR